MKKVLVKWSDNWADEMDIEGFIIMSEKEWKQAVKLLKAKNERFYISIGTNEEIKYENGDALLETLEAIEISKETEKAIVITLGGGYGFTQFENQFEEIEEEEDD